MIKEFISPNVRQTVFAANRLPLYVSLPSYIICNLDPDHLPGSHWIAIYISESGYGEYFAVSHLDRVGSDDGTPNCPISTYVFSSFLYLLSYMLACIPFDSFNQEGFTRMLFGEM